MGKETEQLVVSLEARIRDFERNFDRANRTATRNFDQIERRASIAADRMEKSMSTAGRGIDVALSAMKGGIAGLVAGFSTAAVAGIVSRVGDIAKGVASIGDEARKAGLSTKSFQELKFVAEQNRVSVDALTDGFKELSLRADEFIVTGQGSAAEAFKRLGFTATDLKRKLEDPSALFSEIIGKLQQFDKAAQIRIFDEIMGGSGEQFVQLISQGEEGLRRTVQQAHDLGLVLDDDVITRADEIDRKFSKITQTIGTGLKGAVVAVVGAMDDWLDRFNKLEEQTDRNLQSQLLSTYDKLREAKAALEGLQLDKAAFPEDAGIDLNIDRQKALIEELTEQAMKLRDVLDRRNGYSENFVYKAGEDAKKAKPPVNDLNNALGASGSSAANGANGLKSYADAIRALKEEVPELAKSLADLDAKTRIDAVYRKAVSKARTMGEIYQANEMRGKALSSLNIKSATDDPAGYLSNVLASGKDKAHVTGMQSAFAEKLATMLASMPEDLKGGITVNSGYRSPERQQELWLQALQKYGSPEAARKWVAPPGNSQHNKGNAADLGYSSDAAREWAHQNAGNFGLSFPLSNENWHIEDADARSQQNAETIQKQTEALTQQADSYRQIVTEANAFTAAQGTEQQALGMTATAAAKLRYEQQMLAEAQRAGIQLSPQQRQEISQLAQGMADAEQATLQFATTQEQAQQASQFFAQTAGNALIGVISGTMDAKTALQQLAATIAQAALQAALLGEGPLAGILGGGKGGSGGGGLLGMIFSGLAGAKNGGEIQAFAGGGRVRGPGGPRSDSILARLSDGEHVVNAKAANKNRALLEAINAGKTPALPAVAIGGAGGAGRTVNQVTNTFSPSTTITVQSSGNKEADAALSEKLTRELDTLLENKMVEFTQNQQRPGNMMSKGRFV